ncbi:MAG: PASTA domain-containing protein, partial [Actinomycetes bacterium]
LIEAEKLVVGEITRQNNDNVPEGSVIDQDPLPDVELEEGRKVNLTVSSGVAQATVPTLVGLSLDEATNELRENDLELGTTERVPSDENRNVVTRARPGEGSTVPAGSKVNLEVASGSNTVPDVQGESEDEARRQLEQAGFNVDVNERETGSQPEGTVVDQSPEGGTARLESTVTIVVAKKPPEPTPTPTPTTPPTETTPPPTELTDSPGG